MFKGNRQAQTACEEQARDLTEKWLAWYQTQWNSPGCPAKSRFDYHVCWEPNKDPFLWTCEMSECGVSLCGLPIEARNTCLAHSCLTTKEGGPRVKPLPWVGGEWPITEDDIWSFVWPHGTSLWGEAPAPREDRRNYDGSCSPVGGEDSTGVVGVQEEENSTGVGEGGDSTGVGGQEEEKNDSTGEAGGNDSGSASDGVEDSASTGGGIGFGRGGGLGESDGSFLAGSF